MPFDTQIKSILIPREIWQVGDKNNPQIPPLNLPSRDALAIERRVGKKVDVRNEKRRYTLCCERIQGIACELSYIINNMPPANVWPSINNSDEKHPSARSLFAFTTNVYWWVRQTKKRGYLSNDQFSNFYPRIHTLFFPPEHAKEHLKCYEMIREHHMKHKLFEHAANESSLGMFSLSADQCQKAFYMRYEILSVAATNNWGLVDVWEVM